MQWYLWSDKFVVANRPQSLLHNESDSRIMRVEMSSRPFGVRHVPHAFRRPAQCINRCIVYGTLAFLVLVLVWRYLLSGLPANDGAYRQYERKFIDGVSNVSIRSYLSDLTAQPHVAGTPENHALADYIRFAFQRFGIPTHYCDYEVLLSYPGNRSLILSNSDGLSVEFDLDEEEIDEDHYTKNSRIIPPFHAYSPSANVIGYVVYANYGSLDDFELLLKLGVQVNGSVVLARYGKVFRGDIVQFASSLGAIAVIIFSDPIDYAHNRTEGYYPQSPWLPPSGVQRGTVYGASGDPLTPGWPSTPGSQHIDLKEAQLPTIPSLPISAQNARMILKELTGPDAPQGWQGGLNLSVYRIGGGPAKLNITYEAKRGVYGIRNVIGIIEGSEEPDRFVVVGNHRDAWVYGAVDPGSGTAALLEMAAGFNKIMQQGWRPRRSILLASWDAEEYGMIGSTEWVEENLGLVGASVVAYINVDCAAAGPEFRPKATPSLDNVLREVTRMVTDPDRKYATVYDAWQASSIGAEVGRLGSGGSDFEAFFFHAGIPTLDLAFGDGYSMYHSEYDNFHWMEKFGDPLFHRHVATTSIWGVVTMRLADNAVLPLDYQSYARELQAYVQTVQKKLQVAKAPANVTLASLKLAVGALINAAYEIDKESKVFQGTLNSIQHDLFYFFLRRRAINDRLIASERGLLDSEGIPGRPWYKHMVYGPAVDRYNEANDIFPSVLNAITRAVKSRAEEDWRAVQKEIWRVSRAVVRMQSMLGGKLTQS